MLIGNYFKKINLKYKDHHFSDLSFNSKDCKKDTIFFAIKGTKKDGKKYIKSAIQNGAKTIISNIKFEGIKNNILYIYSKNVRKTLSNISYKYYKNKPKNLIAVTGTNGKSSIADFYFQILELNKKKVASIGTLGVKTIFSKKPTSNTTLDSLKLGKILNDLKKNKIENVILEASSHGLKQNRLDGLNFKTGIFSNLSHDHLDYHKNLKNYLNAKLYLFKKLMKKKSNVITDISIPEYKKIKRIAIKKKINIFTIANNKSDLSIISHKYLDEMQYVKIKYKNINYTFTTNLIGKIQVKNLVMAMLAAEKSNLDFKKIVNVINKIRPVDGRLENIGKIKNKSSVILDYAHTPEALKRCIENIKEQYNGKKISIVFGCGGDRDKKKRSKMGKIANNYCEKIYLTDDNPRKEDPKKIRLEIKKNIKKSKLEEIPSRKKAINKAIMSLNTGDVLIVAGKGHENIQDYGSSKKFFSDRHFIIKNIKSKNKFLSTNLKINILKEESKNKIFPLKVKINKATINSKEIKKNDIFFAIKGKKNDGNKFLKEVFSKRGSLAVVNKVNKSFPFLKQIKVKNTLNFLTKTSSIIRKNSSSKIIAITGSCGKTSLKDLLSYSISKFSTVTYSPKSFNNKYGVPISLFNLNPKNNFGVFEAGMNKKGEINKLTKVLKPDVGVITNISYAHAKNFKNIKEIALAKSEIINNINEGGFLVLNADDFFYKFHEKIALKKNLKVLSFSLKKKIANVKLNYIKKEKLKFKISVHVNKNSKIFFINSIFENNIKNILAAITVISIFKDIKTLDKNIFYKFKIPEGRGDISNIKINKKNILLIDESYNANPLSIKSAIKNFDLIDSKNKKKYLILGDMLELGKHSKKLHIDLSDMINSSGINNVSVYGNDIKETYKKINYKKKGLILREKSQIIDLIKNNLTNNDYLMIKGSNSTGLNKITSYLKGIK